MVTDVLSGRSSVTRLVRLLLPLAVAFLAAGLSTALVGPFLSLFLTTSVHAGPVQITVFLVVSPLAGVVASTLLGRLSDRYPIRRKLLIGAAIAGLVGSALTAVLRDYWLLLIVSVLLTSLAGAMFPQTLAYARQVLTRDDPDRAAMGTSALRTVFSAAFVAGPPLAAVLLRLGDFRYLYGVAAATYAIAALVAIFWLDELATPAISPAVPAVPATPVDVASAMPVIAAVSPDGLSGDPSNDPTNDVDQPAEARWVLLVTAVAFTALQCPMTLGTQALPMFLSADLGGGTSDAGLLLGLCAALEIPLMLGLGALTTRIPVRTLVLVGAACGVTYFGVATLATGVWMLGVTQVVNAIFIASVSGLGISYLQDMLPGHPGRATTLFTNSFPLGAMLAGPLYGVAQQVGFRAAYGMSAALCLIGLVVLLLVRPQLVR